MQRIMASVLVLSLGSTATAQSWTGHHVYLEDIAGERIKIAEITGDYEHYSVAMADENFTDHFLSMRPFKCIEGQDKTWCHVPYPYEIKRNTTENLVDLEYDFLFVWKGRTDYGINMWNGVYYVLEPDSAGFVGIMHEMDMDMLAVPPETGNLRPIKAKHLTKADPESHWLPRLVIE